MTLKMSSYFSVSKCSKILSSLVPDRIAIAECLNAGEDIESIDCSEVLKHRARTNGYLFTKCAKRQGLQFMKFIDPRGNNGLVYVDGHNKDHLQFQPNGNCKPGGLYFADTRHILAYANFGSKLCRVEIPPHAQVYNEEGKHKASDIIVKLNDAISVEKYVSSLSKAELIAMADYELVAKYGNSINPDILDDELIHILLQYQPNIVTYYGSTKKAIKQYVAKCSIDQIKKLLAEFKPYARSQCGINYNASIIRYIPRDILTEEYCEALFKEIVTFDSFTQNIFQSDLSERLQKKNFTKEFYMRMIHCYNMKIGALPHDLVTQEIFDELCDTKIKMGDVVRDRRFAKFLTMKSCSLLFKNGTIGKYDLLTCESFHK